MRENKMGTMPMGKLIMNMALPAMFGMLVIALYNVIDSLFVARISQEALVAVSLAFPIQNLTICIGVGTGIGVSSLISRRLGASEQDDANDAARHGMFLSILNGIGFAIFGLIITPFFYNAFTSNADVLAQAQTYTYIITIASIFVFVGIGSEKVLQATGNMKTPMIQHILGAVVNIILDPILIFGLFGFPAMGVAGAAIATIIGQASSMVFSLYMLYRRPQRVCASFKGMRIKKSVIKDIYNVGFPSIVMQSITSVMIVLMNGILAGFTEVAVSVLGIYFKVQSFVFMPVYGIAQGSLPILGYSYGAGDRQRLTQGFKIATFISLGIMIAGMVLFNLFPAQLIGAFSSSPEMIELGSYAFKIISFCFPFSAIGIIASTMFQAVARGGFSLALSFMRQLIFIIPLAYILGHLAGVNAIWLSFPIAESLAAVVSIFLIMYVYKKDFTKLEMK